MIEAPPAAADGKQKPAHTIRLGRVKATIWGNSSEHGTFYNVTVSRIWKDAEGNWRDSDSFGRDDLPVLQKVLDLAFLWQFEQADKAGA